MKLYSLRSLWEESKQVCARFPLEVIVTCVAVVVCFLIRVNQVRPELIKLLITSNFCLTLSLSADLFSEVRAFTSLKKWTLRILVLLFCGLLYFVLNPTIYHADVFRVALLAIAFHLAVAFVPFLKQGNLNGFWIYNKILFLRILTAGLYAAVLYIGLAIALGSLQILFGAKISGEVYMRLFSLLSAGFVTLFFLAGVPRDLTVLSNSEHPYPKGLKIFTQYVLIPLLTIYLVILLVYEGKIIVAWEFPKGMVSVLVLGYAVLGILSLLLIYPIRGKEGNGWMRWFINSFYLMMIPLVVLLLLAVWTRVAAYGITEPRYILIILALWLSMLTLYFLVSKKGNIKFIPVSLCLLALLSTYGPQSAFTVSKNSQLHRLRKLMAPKHGSNSDEQRQVIHYLVDNHGLAALQEFTPKDLSGIQTRIESKALKFNYPRYRLQTDLLDTAYKIMKLKSRNDALARTVVNFSVKESYALRVSGYDFVIPSFDSHASSASYIIAEQKLVFEKRPNLMFTIQLGNSDPVLFDMTPVLNALKAEYQTGKLQYDAAGQIFRLPENQAVLQKSLGVYDVSFIITQASLDVNNTQAIDKSESFSGYLLLKLKAR